MASWVVRPYERADRPAVRHVCFTTGYMGDPVAWQWRDAESFSDLFTGWYTDHEPESALVVETSDGDVAGYLLGCRDSRRVTAPTAMMRHHLFRRGLLVRPGTAGVLWRSIVDVGVATVRKAVPPAQVIDPRWPAHLHIDLLPEVRGSGAGRELVERWLATLRTDGVPGCHLVTWAENDGAVAFFEAVGFRTEGPPHPMLGMRDHDGGRHHTQLMVQELEGPGTVAPGEREDHR